MIKRKKTVIIVSYVLLLAISVLALSIGRYSIAFSEVFASLTGKAEPSINMVIYNLRLPRVLCAIFIGAALAGSGAAYQGMFQNPLVSPDILGVSSGACIGAIMSIFWGLNSTTTMLFAFTTGIISVMLAVLLSVLARKNRNIVLVFSGVIVGRFMSSVVGILIFFADDESQLGAIIEWEMGSLAKVSNQDIILFGPLLIICLIMLYLMRWRINLLSVGDSEAKALGVDVGKERLFIIILATLSTAVSVCIAGTIAWIGLIVPHICRWLVKDDNRYCMPLNFSLGALALVISDTIARTILPYEMPLEVITGLVGAPVFAAIMIKRWRK